MKKSSAADGSDTKAIVPKRKHLETSDPVDSPNRPHSAMEVRFPLLEKKDFVNRFFLPQMLLSLA